MGNIKMEVLGEPQAFRVPWGVPDEDDIGRCENYGPIWGHPKPQTLNPKPNKKEGHYGGIPPQDPLLAPVEHRWIPIKCNPYITPI